MSFLFDSAVVGMGLGRILLGLAPFVAARPAAQLLGFPAKHDNATARLMARFFGVRDIGLGVLAFYALRHPETAPFIFLFNAAMDAGDLFAISLPILSRDGIDRGAALSAVFAIGGGMGWLVLWLVS
ncbi:MAG: DUF4267 domain-containing protein [Myxococcota bacterium]|nr:DUF4267 domain-containing protein [Deltaproteobacteria bacterium]MDQ3335921.1 DUF4267 domain-containing protein [Myxococcota bacterium]